MKVKRKYKCLIFILTLSLLMMSGSPKAYAGESSGTETETGTSSGKSIYDALSRIYGNNNYTETGSNEVKDSSSTGSNAKAGDGTEELMQEMETGVKGPKVNEGGISELYHEGYKVYEESINDDISVFTNIANGTVVNHAVVMEIPDGVIARMKKNGKTVPIKSEEPISEAGSYVVTFYVMEEDQDELPFSQQSISKAKFRFRIQYKAGVAGYEAQDDSSPDLSSGIPDFSGLTYNEDGSVSGNITGSVSRNDSLSDDEISLLFGDGDEDYLPDDLKEDDYEYDLTESTYEESEETETGTESANEASFLAVNGVSGEYDTNSGFYKNTLLTNDVFYTNVPNGMLTNEPVVIQEAENLSYTVYRDGELFEDFVSGQYIREAGNYLAVISGKDPDFDKTYPKNPPVFRFRIIDGPVSDMSIVNAPENTTFRTVRYEGEEVSDSAIIKEDTLRLIKDGNYEITMDTPGGSTELILSLDTVQPRFEVSLEPNHAVINYQSDDIAYSTLYRNGELVSDSTIVFEITKSGDYTLTAYDKAGNKSPATFRVSYRINAAAVIAILLILALIGGILYYLIRIRKKFKIR